MREIMAKTRQNIFLIHASDGIVPATTLQHSLHLMTRTAKDFGSTQAMLINPWIKEA
jgi:toxin FitB